MDDERVADDLARYTDGRVQLNLDNIRLENVAETAAVMNVNGNRMQKAGKKRKK